LLRVGKRGNQGMMEMFRHQRDDAYGKSGCRCAAEAMNSFCLSRLIGSASLAA